MFIYIYIYTRIFGPRFARPGFFQGIGCNSKGKLAGPALIGKISQNMPDPSDKSFSLKRSEMRCGALKEGEVTGKCAK